MFIDQVKPGGAFRSVCHTETRSHLLYLLHVHSHRSVTRTRTRTHTTITYTTLTPSVLSASVCRSTSGIKRSRALAASQSDELGRKTSTSLKKKNKFKFSSVRREKAGVWWGEGLRVDTLTNHRLFPPQELGSCLSSVPRVQTSS